MKGLAIFGLAMMAAPGAVAMDVEAAHAFVQGSWTGRSETWIFDDYSWQQFNGGTQTDTTFSIEPMPENLFTLVSTQTGRRYVVHVNEIGDFMTWFAEGETQPVGQYYRVVKD